MRSFQARLLAVLVVMAVGVGVLIYLYGHDPSRGESSLIPACTLRSLTGFDCAGCGMTRATHEVLHFRFGNALSYNPLLVLAAPFLIVWCALEGAAWLFQEHYRGPRIRISRKGGWWIFGVIVLYSILRNIPVWPLTLLAPGGLA